MSTLQSAFLFEIDAEIEQPPMAVGATPEGTRLIANILGGTVDGPKLKGTIARSGADWLMMRADGSLRIDVRAAITTHDGAVIYTTYDGRIAIPAEHMGAFAEPDGLSKLDPSQYYFRTAPMFEAAMDGPYAWLNHVVAVGVGRFTPKGVQYKVYQVL